MKWIKRLLVLVGSLVILLGALLLYSYHLAHGLPEWYLPSKLTEAQRREVQNQAHQKLADTLSYAADITNAQRQRRDQKITTNPSGLIGPKTITVTEDEANAFLAELDPSQTSLLRDKLNRFVTDARLVLVDNNLAIVGQVKNLGIADNMVVSIEFQPTIDEQGNLRLKLQQIYGGRLPVPRSLLGSEEDKVRRALEDDLPQWQKQAKLNNDGTTGRFAVQSALAKLLLASLDDQPADPILFLPADVQDIGHKAVPVKLTDVKIADKTLTFTIRPLTEEELKDVMQEIQKPYPGTAEASGE